MSLGHDLGYPHSVSCMCSCVRYAMLAVSLRSGGRHVPRAARTRVRWQRVGAQAACSYPPSLWPPLPASSVTMSTLLRSVLPHMAPSTRVVRASVPRIASFSTSLARRSEGGPPVLQGEGAPPGTVPTDENQSTGLERYELLGKLQGVDVFDMKPLQADRLGTKKDPIVVQSLVSARCGGGRWAKECPSSRQERGAGAHAHGVLENGAICSPCPVPPLHEPIDSLPCLAFPQFPARLIGCTGSPAGSHDTLWIHLKEDDEFGRCGECGSGACARNESIISLVLPLLNPFLVVPQSTRWTLLVIRTRSIIRAWLPIRLARGPLRLSHTLSTTHAMHLVRSVVLRASEVHREERDGGAL